MKKLLSVLLMSMSCIGVGMDSHILQRHASEPILCVRFGEKITIKSKSDSFVISEQGCSPDHWYTYPDLKFEKKTIYKKRIRYMQKAMREEK